MIPHQENARIDGSFKNKGEVARMNAEDGGGAAARMNMEKGLTKPVHSPSGVQKIYTPRCEAPSLRMGGMGWDGRSKVSFNFL